jgi:hypothetical protein
MEKRWRRVDKGKVVILLLLLAVSGCAGDTLVTGFSFSGSGAAPLYLVPNPNKLCDAIAKIKEPASAEHSRRHTYTVSKKKGDNRVNEHLKLNEKTECKW